MGEVWVGEHRMLDRRGAVKLLLPVWSSDPATLERFFIEARATSRIRHPGIVEIVDCGVTAGQRAYIVMELLEGRNLRDHVTETGGADLGTLCGVAEEVASALAAAHAQKIVHRDLKPDNVFVLANPTGAEPGRPRIKVLDFGIAKLVDQSNSSLTGTGILIGTPAYMSPEQCRGRGEVDHRTDIYSLGCILYELAAARPPFALEGGGELIAAHLTEMPEPLRSVSPNVPEPIEALIMAMLAKDPAQRPQSMAEIQAAFCTVRGGASLTPAMGTPTPGSTAVLTPAAHPVPTPRTRLLPGKAATTFTRSAGEISHVARPARGRTAMLVGAAFAAAALVTVAVLAIGKRPAEVHSPAAASRPVSGPPATTPVAPPVEVPPAPPAVAAPATLPAPSPAAEPPPRRGRSEKARTAASDPRDLDALEEIGRRPAQRGSRSSQSHDKRSHPKKNDLDALAE